MRTAITTLVVGGALLTGGGAALADDGHGQGAAGTRQERCLRMAERIAERQGLTVAQLEAKLRQKTLDRIEAALKAGKLTDEQAAALKKRVNEWKLCSGMSGGRGHGKHLRFAAVASMMAGAADYLDLSRSELRSELKAGKSLGDIATAKGKSVSGLKQAMLAKITARLDKAVTDGKLADARRDALLERYGKLADRLIEKHFA
jgi:hypothetical protein